ncbi:MAG: transcription antitermination factor NusB [Dermatophilaceae bacterium]
MTQPSREPSRPPPTGRRGPRRRSLTQPAQRTRAADPARLVAYEVLRAVDDGAYTNLELPSRLRQARVTGRDAAFATELTYGATRMRGLYDPIIEVAAGRPLDALEPAVLDVLRLGAHQLLGMRVPAHAACDSTVALARQTRGQGVAGLVNAALHRITERSRDEWLAEVAPADATQEARLATVTSHPAWIVRALRAALLGHGASVPETVDADLRCLLDADNAAPRVTLALRPGLTDIDEVRTAGARPGALAPTAAVLAEGGDPGALAAVRQGRAAVQDEASQLVALALVAVDVAPARTPDAGSLDAAGTPDTGTPDTAGSLEATDGSGGDLVGERWLDLCAGPGGKAGLLAALARQRGATLFANDVSEHRAQLVRQSVRATAEAGADVYVGVGDGRELGVLEPASYDRVLVDAPCTGLGALRRRPEARWRRAAQDLPGLTALQGELLDSALAAVRPGGVVLYATCSPHLAETRYVVQDAVGRAQARGLGVQMLDTAEAFRAVAVGELPDTGTAPYVQLWPHLHGTDGMFAALLRRTA